MPEHSSSILPQERKSYPSHLIRVSWHCIQVPVITRALGFQLRKLRPHFPSAKPKIAVHPETPERQNHYFWLPSRIPRHSETTISRGLATAYRSSVSSTCPFSVESRQISATNLLYYHEASDFFDRPVGGALWMLCLQATAPPARAVSSEASFVLQMKMEDLYSVCSFSEWL